MSRLPALSLDGAHVLITGGSSGIGRAVADLAASKGAHVTLLARNPERLASAMDEIEATCVREGQRVLGLRCDVTQWEQVSEAVAHAERDFGPIDVLFACAGYCYPARFAELPIEEFEGMVGTNLLGTMYAARAVAPGMIARGHGHIAVVSSMGGLVGVYGYSAYSASKFGVVGFAAVLRNEMKPHGVGVTVLCPPNVDTPGYAREITTEPAETAKINGNVKAVSPESMGRAFVAAVERRRYLILPKFTHRLLYRVKGLVPEVFFAWFDHDVRAVQRARTTSRGGS
jgi:3-dehydrosphinganine reductase